MTSIDATGNGATLIEEQFDTAQEMFDAMRRSGSRWEPDPKLWIFRGHADASWPLLPSTLRPNQSALTHHPKRKKGPYPRTEHQIEQELAAVHAFVAEANYHGLVIPGPAADTIRILETDWFSFGRDVNEWSMFPRLELLEAFALAQHHGVPTRLLDWTRNAFTASYFAAAGAATALNQGTAASRLGVWAFCPLSLDATEETAEEKILVVDPPRAPNRNLLAQNGVFTVHVHPVRCGEPTRATPLDQVVTALRPAKEPSPVFGTPLRHLTLPTEQARHLLVLLAGEDVTAAKLFPGYDGIARELSERLLLRQSYRSPPETG